ncbi:unnamed protein product [Pylaiella littoralis]
MGYRSSRSGMLAACCCTVVLVGPHRGAAAFMLPSSVPLANSCSSSRSRSNRNSSPKPWLLDTPACSTIRAFSEPACAAVKQTRRTSRGIAGVVPLSASPIKGDSSSSSSSRGLNGRKPLPEPVMYAQEVLDRAWRSKRRIAAQGKGKPLKQRLMSAFGQTSAVFVDDREFMEETLDNVLRIYCTHNMPNWSLPWQRLKQEQSTSTGFVIDGRRIITNAHSVEYATMIQVRRRGCDRKFQATRFAVGEECDLAILTVDDEDFWEGASPLAFGELPELTDDVNVIGYPVGGECVSITAGVVSRVEMTVYAQAEEELLSIQIDAAINPGNSGGPVVNDDGEVVGVAFQSLGDSDVENIGYVVPVNVLEHFLEDVSRHNGKYRGFPRLGISHQPLENPALRGSLRMSPEQTGVMVTRVLPTYPSMKLLRRGDVVLKVDGIKVANDGSIPLRAGERVALKYYMSQLFPEDKTEVEVLRDDKVMTVTVPLAVSDYLSPVHFDGRSPSYFVLGGLVFTIMSTPFLENEIEEGEGNLAYLLSTARYGVRSSSDEEVVILTQVLAHEVNVGYEGFANLRLLSFNGERVKSLKHLVRLADENQEEFLRFDLFQNRLVVLEAAAVPEATAQICEDNSIPSQRSADLMIVDAEVEIAADEAPPPLVAADGYGGLEFGTEREAEGAETETESEGGSGQQEEQQQQQQQPAAGVNGGKPRQPAIAPGAAVPARRKLGHKQQQQQQQQQRRGTGAAARAAEPKRSPGRRRARLRSAAVAAVRRVGDGAAAAGGGLRIEGGALCRRWLTRRKSGK